MNTAKQVANKLEEWQKQGLAKATIAWMLALACVGWAYVFGARGQYCDPVNRRNFFSSQGSSHPTIKSACKNFNGSDQQTGACSTCKFYPGGRTRFFDCRGFTYWILKQVFGWELQGAGATSQWNTASNWKQKGPISEMPKDTLCCIFVRKGNKMEHTGLGLNNETIECSAGVQHFTTRKAKWTHYAVPACIDGTIPEQPTEKNAAETKPSIRRGSKGKYVTLAQTALINKGYDLGKYGADGDYGPATEAAVKKFQQDHGLTQDGVIGPATWDALDKNEPAETYTVTIQHLTGSQADALIKSYPGSTKKKEG